MSVRQVLEEIDLRGSSVRLHPPRLEDAERTYALIAGRREILDWIEWAGPKGAEDLREKALHWRTQSDDAANYQLAISRAGPAGQEGLVVGAMSIRFIDHPDRGDLGYWIAVEQQGRGFASDAVGLAVWLAFEVLGAKSLSACVFQGNVASRRVLEKHGFELREQAAGSSSCGQRPRWYLALEREAWSANPRAQRPLEFHFGFATARP